MRIFLCFSLFIFIKKNYNRRKIFVYLFLIEKIQSGTPVHNWKRSFAGNTTAVYSEAAHHVEVLIMNKNRRIRPTEVKEILAKLLKRLPKEAYDPDEISIIELNHVTEVSVPLKVSLMEN